MDASQTADSPRYQQALEYLFQRINYERTTQIPYRSRSFKLDRMQALMDALGNPERKSKIIHVAGTKGKGSTSGFLSHILWESGYRVGRFTSPHLERLEERFWIDGENCSADDIADLVECIAPIVERMDQDAGPEDRLTFFEITTAMGFLLFARQEVDFAVVEVGLGGRLDSTNVCSPALCIITSISRDHTALLGDTLAEIAGEKAGIIKPEVPVISGVLPEDARQVITDVAARQNAPCFQRNEHFRSVPQNEARPQAEIGMRFCQAFDFEWNNRPAKRFQIGVKGNHQVANAGLAIAAVELLREAGHSIDDVAVEKGLLNTKLPARIECLSEDPVVIVDAAHNDASAAALVEVLQQHFPGRRRHLVYASSGDKDHAAVLGNMLEVFDQVWFTKYGFSPRAAQADQLKAIAESIPLQRPVSMYLADEAKAAFHEAWEATGKDDVLVISGSFFIAAEFKRFWDQIARGKATIASSAAG
ncbi:bifunctional folylpolyglutamate synthase/dihydrofolate synthase [bacterium]|nr:bifunctional folylpolyglutamate synthase/dihydrofolate synthase [bacterium]